MGVELKAPKGKFRVVCVDTFSNEDWVHGDFDTKQIAINKANKKGGNMLKAYVYDDQGKWLHGAGSM